MWREPKEAAAVALKEFFDFSAVNTQLFYEEANVLLRLKPKESVGALLLNLNRLVRVVTLRHGAVCALRVYLSYKDYLHGKKILTIQGGFDPNKSAP